MGNPLDVVTRFTADVAGLQKGAADAQTAIGKVGPQAAITSLAVVGMATAAVGAIGAMTIAAADDEAAQALLEEAYRNTGAATGDYIGQINAAIDAGTSLGFTDDQTRAALTSLISATHDAGKANEDLKTAQDIARFAGVDLATAADAVAKAQAGQATQLTRLLPGLEKGKTATETLANAQKLAAGSADTYAASTKGQGDVANASLVQLTQTIGAAFIPVLSELTSILVGVAKVMNDNAGVVKVLVAVVGILAAGILAANIAIKAMEAIQIAVKVATMAWTAVQWLLNAALDANPIGLVVIAIAALVAGLILVYTNSKQVRDAIGGIIDFLKNLLDWIGKAVDALGHLLDSLNPLKGISLPSLPSLPFSAGPSGATAGAYGTVTPYSVSGTVNVNVYGGDPRAVTQAVKDGFRRWTATEGKNAPGQDW